MERFWVWVLEPLLERLKPSVIVEVGSEYGRTTGRLLSFAAEHDCRVHAVDPEPRFDVEAWQAEHGERFCFHRLESLNALEHVGPCDAVLLDGDHNWYSVFHELKLLESLARRHRRAFPLVFLHDVGWPYGRRDLYYHPDRIPGAHRQPFAKRGLRLDSPELAAEGGFNAHLNHSLYENSLHNGVRTAAEEFCAAAEEPMELVVVPGFHGLGIVVPRALREMNDELSSWLDRLDATLLGGGYVEALERSRLEAEVARQQRGGELEEAERRHRDETARLETALAEQADRVTQLESRLDERGRRLDEHAARVSAFQDQLEARTAELGQRTVELEEKADELGRQTARATELEQRGEAQDRFVCEQGRRLEEETRRTGHLQQQLRDAGEQIAQLVGDQQRHVGELARLRSHVARSDEGRTQTQRELAASRDRLHLCQADLDAARSEHARLEALLLEHGTRIDAYRRWITSLESAAAALLGTKRWRVGDLLVGLCRRVLGRPPSAPAPVTVLRDTFARFHRHEQKHPTPHPRPLPPKAPPAAPPQVDASANATQNRAKPRADVGRAFLAAATDPETFRVLFILPVKGGGGGAHSVVQEACGMRGRGIPVRIAIERRHRQAYMRNYPEIARCDELFLCFSDLEELGHKARDFDVVIGTAFNSMEMVQAIVERHPGLMPAYYVQDYEPLFFPEFSPDWKRARDSYGLVPGTVLFAKTDWICKTVEANHGVKVEKVRPSLDTDVYFVDTRAVHPPLPVRITAMIRPSTPRRAPERTMRVLKKIKSQGGEKVEVHLFGCSDEELASKDLVHDFPFINHGVLIREQVAELARQCDVFVDLSDYQAFGRTALEAMACGCAVVVPSKGGAAEYALEGMNARVVDTHSEEACYAALSELVSDDKVREALRREGLKKAAEYSIRRAVDSEIDVLKKHWQVRRRSADGQGSPRAARLPTVSPGEKLRVAGILPTVTTNYYTGTAYIRVILPLAHPAVARALEFSPCEFPAFFHTEAEVVVVQRNVLSDAQAVVSLIEHCRRRGTRIVYELDDDLFAESNDLRSSNSNGERLRAARIVAEHADLVTVSTPRLGESIRQINPKVRVIPNVLDERLWYQGEPDPHLAPSNDRPLGLLYMGTKTHLNDLRMIEAPLRQILADYGDRVRFDVVGCVPETVREPWFHAIPIPRESRKYPGFVGWLRQTARWDIGIAPLENTRFNNFKSPLKFLDYSALGLASVCSDVTPYRSAVTGGTNGILVPSDEASWYQALKLLIEDDDLRLKLATRAYRDVRQRNVLEVGGAAWLETYRSLKTRDATVRSRPSTKLLLKG